MEGILLKDKNKSNKKYCRQCGREISNGHDLCEKHYQQFKKYGVFLEDNQRDVADPNEIIVNEKERYAEVVLYNDLLQEELEERILIDLEDVESVKYVRWNKKQSCIVGNVLGKNILLANYILNTDNKIEFIDGNFYNCRKENLKVIEKRNKKNKKNKDNKITIETIGGSTVDVTGSCFSISYPKNDGTMGLFLVECGMIQGGTVLQDYNDNKRMINAVPFEEAEFILVGHSHIDHIGNICASIPNGFKGKIYSTKEALAINEKLLLDCAFIHERNIKDLNKGGRKYEPLFDESDIYLAINKFSPIERNEIVKINDYVSVRFLNNAHCYGASQIEIYIKKPSNHVTKILYTSDLGSNLNIDFQPFVKENDICKKADIMIMESTYGDRSSFTKAKCVEERQDLLANVEKTIKDNHRCLIPCFSFQRSQMALCMLYDHFKDKDMGNTMVVVDSRLTNEVNNVYLNTLQGEEREYFKEVLAWDRIKYISSFKDTEKLMVKKDQPMIIISSSGMVENGHSKSWAKALLPCKNDAIYFIGYCGKNTLGNKIQNEHTKTVTIDGVVYNKRCNIIIYKTFSSHAQQVDLLNYIKRINVGKSIILHHGSEEAKNKLKELATEELHKIGKTTKIITVGKGCDTFKI